MYLNVKLKDLASLIFLFDKCLKKLRLIYIKTGRGRQGEAHSSFPYEADNLLKKTTPKINKYVVNKEL